MLDVHEPHEPIHGWRDFLLHLLTITIGLCIALALEGLVEFAHHKHIVHEARENIRHEIEVNHGLAQQDLQYVQQGTDRMKANIAKLQQLARDPKHFRENHLEFTMTWSSPGDSAWRSSRDMGALTYMPYSDVQNFADIYAQQELVRQQAVEISTRQAYTAAPLYTVPDPSDLSPADLHSLIGNAAQTYIGLVELHQILEQLDRQYTDALKHP